MAPAAKKPASAPKVFAKKIISKPRAGHDLMPARRCQDALQSDIMRFDRDAADQLLVECHPASRAVKSRQQLIIIPFTPTKPAPVKIEGYPRHEDQVQPV